MKNLISKIAMAVTMSCIMVPFTASAHDEQCSTNDAALEHVGYVIDAIAETTFYENPKHPKKKSPYTADLLEAKAMAAQAYVNDHKYSDAVSKLEGIVSNVSKLLDAPKEKIEAYSGSELLDRSMEAIYCVVDLQ
jgi:hypothetical protein